jgi:hypothetical protein
MTEREAKFEAVRKQMADAMRRMERDLADDVAAFNALTPREQQEAQLRHWQALLIAKE